MQENNDSQCFACGMEIGQDTDKIKSNANLFCLWCWSNDCCRVSREASEVQRGQQSNQSSGNKD